jgi:DNA-binding PadR family transcriptional regulator
MAPARLGEFEQQLLLVILRLGSEAFAPQVARELEEVAGRNVSRGALYTTLDRLETKSLLRWRETVGGASREGLPRRLYSVTPAGIAALRSARAVLRELWRGLEHVLEKPTQ